MRTIKDTNEETVLKLENVSKNFGGIQAVDDFSFEVKKGELRCLIGPNGAGKTTVFNLITGVYPVSEGKIIYKGEDITKMPAYKRSRNGIAIKMQIPGVYESLTLRDNLKIACYNFLTPHCKRRELEKAVDELIAMVGLESLGDPIVGNLSHGQQQWLEIAMTLAAKPDLLLLDELAAGFGPEETAFTAKLVKMLHEQGLTILFIDHDMDFVREIAQKVTVMHFGKKFAEGEMSDIEQNEDVQTIYLGRSQGGGN